MLETVEDIIDDLLHSIGALPGTMKLCCCRTNSSVFSVEDLGDFIPDDMNVPDDFGAVGSTHKQRQVEYLVGTRPNIWCSSCQFLNTCLIGLTNGSWRSQFLSLS